ncbi:MAG: hypothetical protein A2020_09245 [Lentisphaerae bacterium GWF2_45_14]|nr:MAG: hypothetical protein A2020_09245 [Lentisphaerae bacterium GWF2_45_14]
MKKWLWGEGHCHSNFSDGFHSIKELTQLYEEYEIDFRFQTDHVFAQMPQGRYMNPYQELNDGHCLLPETVDEYLSQCKSACSTKHLVIPGAEFGLQFKPGPWTLNRYFDHHILIRPLTKSSLPKEKDLKEKWWPDIWNLCSKSTRGQLSMAHVSDDKSPWQILPELPNLNSLELVNNLESVEPADDRKWLSWWDYMLSMGKRIVLTTGSDSHQGDLWCASAMRNVVRIEGTPDAGKLTEALYAGKSYLSGTFHPDIWRALGEKGILPERNGFTPWFSLGERISRKEASGKVWEWIAKGIENNYGRIKKKDFPKMEITVNGAEIGDELSLGPKKRVNVNLAIRMNVPISKICIIVSGKVLWSACPLKNSFKTEIDLDLGDDAKYLRVIVSGNGENKDQKETLISNPVWLRKAKEKVL